MRLRVQSAVGVRAEQLVYLFHIIERPACLSQAHRVANTTICEATFSNPAAAPMWRLAVRQTYAVIGMRGDRAVNRDAATEAESVLLHNGSLDVDLSSIHNVQINHGCVEVDADTYEALLWMEAANLLDQVVQLPCEVF